MGYPLMLYLKGREDVNAHAIAQDPEHEKELRKKGYKDMEEFSMPIAPVAVVEDAPKRRGRKKAE